MPDKLSPNEITELVCTRISHDLIGNIGAVANAIELMDEEDPSCLQDVKPILEISSQTLTARLKFFRLAFGLNNAAVKNTDEIKTLATNYLSTIGGRNSPVELKMSLHTPELYKVVLLGVMILSDVFIRSGTLSIEEKSSGLVLSANSPSPLSVGKLNIMQSVLNGKIPEENPAQLAPLFYLKNMLAKTAIKINLAYDENQAILQIG